jgi:cell division protein FtsL
MAKNRKSQSASIRFGPALKALFLCLLIAGSAVGYVWQKSQIYQLGKQMHEKETVLTRLRADNQKLEEQLADLRSVRMLDQRAANLGLSPALPMQVVRLPEPAFAPAERRNLPRQLAILQAEATTQ